MSLTLANLQLKQHHHDLGYHQDIISLGTQDRAKHLVLHFSKYCGKLTEKNDKTIVDRTLVDIMICCFSFANLLNIDLDAATDNPKINTLEFDNFPNSLVIATGKMAKACEAMDHLEPYPSHDELSQQLKNVTNLTINAFVQNNLNMDKLISKRWETIEKKSIFHKGKLEISKVKPKKIFRSI